MNSTGKIIGYARVSAADQNLDRQLEALSKADKVFTEKASGKNTRDRPELSRMLEYVRDGDTVLVKSPDRLARSTTDLLALIEQLREKDVSVEFIDNPALNTDTPQGEFMITVLAAMAQLERATIRERQAEGIAIAKKKGTYARTMSLSPEQIVEARERIAGGVPHARIARELGVARTTLYAALSGTGAYARVLTHETQDSPALRVRGAWRVGGDAVPAARRSPPVCVAMRDLRDGRGLSSRGLVPCTLVAAHVLDIAVALVLRDLHARLGAHALDEVADESGRDD